MSSMWSKKSRPSATKYVWCDGRVPSGTPKCSIHGGVNVSLWVRSQNEMPVMQPVRGDPVACFRHEAPSKRARRTSRARESETSNDLYEHEWRITREAGCGPG